MFFRKSGGTLDYLVVGLGNPGKKYEQTRHNIGFRMLDHIADRQGIRVTRSKFQALCGAGRIAGARVLLLKPVTFMNLSGGAVRQAANFYHLTPEQVVVIFDDVSLDPGVLRIRAEGSAGGHNGIKSIIQNLGGEGFPRIKVGVGKKPRPDDDLADWVLASPSADDRKRIDARADDVNDALELILHGKLSLAQSRFNG